MAKKHTPKYEVLSEQRKEKKPESTLSRKKEAARFKALWERKNEASRFAKKWNRSIDAERAELRVKTNSRTKKEQLRQHLPFANRTEKQIAEAQSKESRRLEKFDRRSIKAAEKNDFTNHPLAQQRFVTVQLANDLKQQAITEKSTVKKDSKMTVENVKETASGAWKTAHLGLWTGGGFVLGGPLGAGIGAGLSYAVPWIGRRFGGRFGGKAVEATSMAGLATIAGPAAAAGLALPLGLRAAGRGIKGAYNKLTSNEGPKMERPAA